ERGERVLERDRQIDRLVGEAFELAQPKADVVRRRAAAGAELGVLAQRVQRVTAEADGEHFERHVELAVAAALAAALLDDLEDLGGCARDGSPRFLEVGRIHAIAGGPRGEERAPEAQRERAGAALD